MSHQDDAGTDQAIGAADPIRRMRNELSTVAAVARPLLLRPSERMEHAVKMGQVVVSVGFVTLLGGAFSPKALPVALAASTFQTQGPPRPKPKPAPEPQLKRRRPPPAPNPAPPPAGR